jgi:glycosyltransferase involved in cell wall biosynthesis
MNKKQRLLFISWASDCARSDGIATRLGGKSYMIYAPFWGSRYSTIVFKYISQSVKTLAVLFRERPRFIFVMSPPIVACLPIWLYKIITGADYVIDAHTAAFTDPRWQPIIFMHRFFSRRARTTIVTNEYLRDIVVSWGAHATIVADVPIASATQRNRNPNGQSRMTFISSFTKDEPLSLFLTAAARLPQVRFYVTGDYRAADRKILEAKPRNVEFTGFLPRPEYAALLTASDAIICLTTLNHAMQRGAYEAVYHCRPVVTSNTEVLRRSFYKGAVHVDNTVESIVAGMEQMGRNLDKYRLEVEQLRMEKLENWRKVEQELRHLLWGEPDKFLWDCQREIS